MSTTVKFEKCAIMQMNSTLLKEMCLNNRMQKILITLQYCSDMNRGSQQFSEKIKEIRLAPKLSTTVEIH